MKIIGISAFYHDSSAALIIDGDIIAAAQEERFTRKKFDPSFPIHSINFCLKAAQLKMNDIDEIVYYEKPFLTFERLLQSILAQFPKSFLLFLSAMPIWMREKLNTRKTMIQHLKQNFPEEKLPTICFSQHHLSHASSAFYPSPFHSAAILCLDGVGEWACTSAWHGQDNKIESKWEMHFPHSLGLLYSSFTYFCGFKVNSGEYKLMGLAPFGQPLYIELIKEHLIDIKDDGSFRLNMDYFAFANDQKMITEKFSQLFKTKPRIAESEMPPIYKDIAASIQKVTEEILTRLCHTLKKQTGEKNLCLAGGVALNCVANSFLLEQKIFENIWVQPAAGDAGGSIGAALASYYLQHKKNRRVNPLDSMNSALLGPEFSDTEIEHYLLESSLQYKKLNSTELTRQAAKDLKDKKIVAWFQGKMEFGPRALGNRSILGDARPQDMQKHMNLKIKFRESFRPFAPIVLLDKIQSLFDFAYSSPYMLFTAKIKTSHSSAYPAITHVDKSSRIQSVEKFRTPQLYELLKEYEQITGCPLLINTSFNVRGEPIVCSPKDALHCFMATDIDSLFVGSFYLQKELQPKSSTNRIWRNHFELD